MLPDGRLGVVDFGACAVWPPDGFDELAQDCVRAVFRGGPRELEAARRPPRRLLPPRSPCFARPTRRRFPWVDLHEVRKDRAGFPSGTLLLSR
ncbi:hypothetical protein [Nocardia amikacinitolerans]|uniref:hypothetical protein n=1 Tax=Nocardia amikacinitolerans TaxID=756689 RepID=UPI001FEA3A58|nr:hypothetical protein [Nocardia amikacinitolerans]